MLKVSCILSTIIIYKDILLVPIKTINKSKINFMRFKWLTLYKWILEMGKFRETLYVFAGIFFYLFSFCRVKHLHKKHFIVLPYRQQNEITELLLCSKWIMSTWPIILWCLAADLHHHSFYTTLEQNSPIWGQYIFWEFI